tara:strand:- start:15 stop:476 length:462 start_codon:yes stop_codon:yes gene_type:complete
VKLEKCELLIDNKLLNPSVNFLKEGNIMLESMSKTMDLEDLKKQLEKLEKKSRRAELLLSVNRKVSGLTDLNTILFNIIDEVVSELGAERGSLFLNDNSTNELYSRVAQGELTREIRFLNTSGIAGSVFHSKKGEIIHDVTSDQRLAIVLFNC